MDRSKLVRLLLVVPMLAAGIALGAPRGASAASSCTGDVVEATIKESVVVPAGATCRLYFAVVRGGVSVGAGASLYTNGAEIRGGVTGADVTNVSMQQTVVRGGVAVAGARDGVYLANLEVRGAVTVTGVAMNVAVWTSVVRGSVTITDNRYESYPYLTVSGNTIAGNLNCANNDAELTNVGVPNTVGGAKLGQCAGL